MELDARQAAIEEASNENILIHNNNTTLTPSVIHQSVAESEQVQEEETVSVETPNISESELSLLEKAKKNYEMLIKGQEDFLKNKKATEKKMSPLLDAGEKEAMWNLGQSMDSKKVTSALGYLDLKQICYCLAQALAKHIQFSRG